MIPPIIGPHSLASQSLPRASLENISLIFSMQLLSLSGSPFSPAPQTLSWLPSLQQSNTWSERKACMADRPKYIRTLMKRLKLKAVLWTTTKAFFESVAFFPRVCVLPGEFMDASKGRTFVEYLWGGNFWRMWDMGSETKWISKFNGDSVKYFVHYNNFWLCVLAVCAWYLPNYS